jgi:predicted permease
MESLTQALRRLWLPRNRGYALTAVFTLALSVAALCAVGMLFHALILAPLPYSEPERVVFLNERNEAKGIDQFSVSAPNFRSWQAGARSFSELAAFVRMDANLGGDGVQSAERAMAYRASWNLWRTLELRPLLGNTFDARAEQERAAVVMLSESLWRRRYGADPAIVGRAVLIDNVPHVVLGVVPTDHGFINEGALWLPLPDEEYIHHRDDRRWDVVGRLAPGVTSAAAASELEALSSALAREFPDSNQGWQARLHDARAWILGPHAATRIAVTLAAVLLLLLVACTNIANLQVARASARLGEYSVRHALGASRWRMLRDALGESSLLAVLGASLGVVLAAQLLPMALAWLPASTPRLSTVRFEPEIAWITVLASVLVAMLFGLAPAMLAARRAPGAMLVRAGRGALSGTSARLRHALVVVQFALASALTVSPIMLAQQFLALARADRALPARTSSPRNWPCRRCANPNS